MSILERLTQLANKLDQKGLYSEATMVDDIVKKANQEKQQQLQELSKNMANKLIDTIVSQIGGGAKSGGQKAVIERYKGKDYFTTYREITEFVNTQPELRGALNAGLAAVAPMMSQYTQVKQQAIQPPVAPDVGIAGKQQPKILRDPKVMSFQKQYNQIRKQLADMWVMDIRDLKRMFPWLKPDGIPGPKTAHARRLFPKIQQKIQQAEQKKPQTPAPSKHYYGK